MAKERVGRGGEGKNQEARKMFLLQTTTSVLFLHPSHLFTVSTSLTLQLCYQRVHKAAEVPEAHFNVLMSDRQTQGHS